MASAEEIPDLETKSSRSWLGLKRVRLGFAMLGALFLAGGYAWTERVNIANDLIADQLDALGIEARYEIEEIGLTRQVLRNFSVGNPSAPDLTIERIELVPDIGLFGAGIDTLTLARPRLRASYREGILSLGALDPVLEGETSGDAGLPAWSLGLVDAQVDIETDFGSAQLVANGSGRLAGGFQSAAAINAANWHVGECSWARATIEGELRTSEGRAYLDAPLKLEELKCPQIDLAQPQLDINSTLVADADLAGISGTLSLSNTNTSVAENLIERLEASAELDWREGVTNARYAISAQRLQNSYATISDPMVEGAMRLRAEDGRWEVDAEIAGRDLDLNSGSRAALAGLVEASNETFLAPLLDKFASALSSGLRASKLNAEMLVRRNSDGLSVVVPTARLHSEAGDQLFAISQGQWQQGDGGALRLAGNIASEGPGMPRLQGRMESTAASSAVLRMQMETYQAQDSSLTIPELRLEQSKGGDWRMRGRAIASGAIPGGSVSELEVPIQGRVGRNGAVALWQTCANVRFARLQLADLDLLGDQIAVCPGATSAIVQTGRTGWDVSAKVADLEVQGELGESPIRLASGEVEFANQIGLSASEISVALGPQEASNRLSLGRLSASFDEGVAGRFSEVSARLDSVPLNIEHGQGSWRYADGALTISETQFDLFDRAQDERFESLHARDAEMRLEANQISATALLRHPATDRPIVATEIEHDLTSGAGRAVLDVPGIVFDDQLEPGARIDQCVEGLPPASGATGLSCLATGVIALAEGVVTGSGRIDWNSADVTSQGSFSTEGFDFAAAFGPVQDVSGTIHFSDLLSLTTAGTQSINIGAIDPGVVVFDGVLDFALIDGTLVSLRGGRWPFFGGTMELRPTELNFAVAEERSYIIEITGVDAAQFIAAMDFSNISASGTFDGAVPLVFDELGNGRITNGLLISRPPGGNLSYVGELTYEDTGVIANYAFQSLRSLDFNQMMVEMDGPLTGEIITRLLFDGVSQGKDADRNFITKQIAKLPIRFNVNVRASFYELMNDLLRTYDPATNIDPGALGLIRGPGGRMVRPSVLSDTGTMSTDVEQDELPIQTEESETLP